MCLRHSMSGWNLVSHLPAAGPGKERSLTRLPQSAAQLGSSVLVQWLAGEESSSQSLAGLCCA
jgi:hypothetical protein